MSNEFAKKTKDTLHLNATKYTVYLKVFLWYLIGCF